VSAFDDEFGLFGGVAEDAEARAPRTPRPPAPPPARHERGTVAPSHPKRRPSGRAHREQRADDPVSRQRRAAALVEFLAKKLVTKPDDVRVDLFLDEEGEPVIELIVHPDDLGKVVGRNGRVAHALRVIARASAEGRIAVDILDSEEAAAGE